MILNETYTLANGLEIPKLGLGTWMIEGEAATNPVQAAINLGYRHITRSDRYANY